MFRQGSNRLVKKYFNKKSGRILELESYLPFLPTEKYIFANWNEDWELLEYSVNNKVTKVKR